VCRVDIDECRWSDDRGGCALIADCVNTAGGYICKCPVGTTGDGFHCKGFSQARYFHTHSSLNVSPELLNVFLFMFLFYFICL